MRQTGIGNHPAFIRTLYTLSRIANGGQVAESPRGAGSIAAKMYPSTGSNAPRDPNYTPRF